MSSLPHIVAVPASWLGLTRPSLAAQCPNRGPAQAGTENNSMREDLPVWRSLMFVPVNVDKFVKTGADRGADGIILDLEDSVAPSQKDRARTLIAYAIPHFSRNGAD